MPQVRAQVVYDGKVWQVVRDIPDTLPAHVIGECVSEAVHKAWKSGVDPVLGIVIVTFN